MRGIVQYVVYVLTQGQWYLHARYRGAQRVDAINDASSTESDTGRATKVVRDTYWPDVNENEEVTTYLSPKARALQAMNSRRKQTSPVVVQAGRPAAPLAERRRAQKMVPVLRNVRLIVALGVGLFVASALTAALSVAMHRAALQLEIEPSNSTIILTIAYLLIFSYVFRRTSRAHWRLHQMVAEMWENADKPAAPKFPPRRAMARGMRPSPSGAPWQVVAERRPARREAEPKPAADLLKPSQLQPPPSFEDEEPDPMPIPSWEKAKLAEEQAAKEAKEAKAAKKKAAAEAEAAAAKKAADVESRPPELDDSDVSFTPANIADVPAGLALERIILRRFAVDVVIPTIMRSHRDDPVTRRGIALLLSGAVRGLVETSPVSEAGAMALLAEVLRESGSKPAVIESFLGNYEASMSAENAQPLLESGRAAIKHYVDGGRDVDRMIQQAISLWRFPSTARVLAPPPEFYLFSIARDESLTDGEPTAGLLLQQAIVRAAVQEQHGDLVPHDGAGSLARFNNVKSAFTAARAVQTRVAAAAGPGTATVVVEGPVTEPGVPRDTASVLERVRTLLAVTLDGEIVGDASAQRLLGDAMLPAEAIPNRDDAVRIPNATEAPTSTTLS